MLFGKYYYANDADMRPIVWLPIDETKEAILYVTKYCIDYKPYSIEEDDSEWSRSTIRKWLNTDFITIAFTEEERRLILPKEHKNEGNDSAKIFIVHKETVKDYIFLLSKDEVDYYSPDGYEYEFTPFAVNKTKGCSVDSLCEWTRTSGYAPYNGALRSFIGVAVFEPFSYEAYGFPNFDLAEEVLCENGIRPAFWMKKGELAQ